MLNCNFKYSYSLCYLVKKFETEKQALSYAKKCKISNEMIPEKVTNN